MTNITTSRAEMLQNVMHVNTENIHKYIQGKVQHHPAWGSSWSPGFLCSKWLGSKNLPPQPAKASSEATMGKTEQLN